MSTRRALAFSFLDRYAGLVLAILSSMVIARLLTPSQIGVYSVAMVLLSFISSLRDMGAGQYLVQERELTPERVRAAWTVQLGMGTFFAMLVLAAAKPVSVFYREPIMFDMMLLLALNFAISPFGSLTYAWLMREMSFGKLAVMRFASSLAGAIVSIVLALYGHGAMSLAIGSLVATATNAACAMAFRPTGYPWWPGGRAEIRRVLTFGSKISVTSVLNTLTFSSPELALGKLQTMLDVGLFSRANGLITMFNKLVLDATNAVVVSTFAKDARAGHDVGPGFLRASAYVTVLGWTFFAMIMLFSHPILHLLYGPQWDASVPTVRLMSVGMAIGLTCALYPSALMAVGRADLVLGNTIASGLIYAPIMIGGAFLGLEYMGWGFIAASAIISSLWIKRSSAALNTSILSLLSSFGVSAKVTLVGILPGLYIYLHNGDQGQSTAALFIAAPFCILFFCLACRTMHHPIDDEIKRFVKLTLLLLRKAINKN